jgi:hypothetical protein
MLKNQFFNFNFKILKFIFNFQDQFSFPLSTNDDINYLEIQQKSIAAKKRFGNLLI